MSVKETIENLLSNFSQKASNANDVFDHVGLFLKDSEVDEDDKIAFILLGFYYRIDHPLGSYTRQLSSQHHQLLSSLVFLSDEVMDEQAREDLSLYIILTLLFQSLKKVFLLEKNENQARDLFTKYFMTLATFRSFMKIQQVMNYHQRLLSPLVESFNTSLESSSVMNDLRLLERMKEIFDDAPLFRDFLSRHPVLSVMEGNALNPAHPSWLQNAMQGLFKILASEDQIAFLGIFSRKWLPLYQSIASRLNDVIDALIDGLDQRKDVPISILEDVLITFYHLGNESVKMRIYRLGWENLRLTSVRKLFPTEWESDLAP